MINNRRSKISEEVLILAIIAYRERRTNHTQKECEEYAKGILYGIYKLITNDMEEWKKQLEILYDEIIDDEFIKNELEKEI